jgi:hypothetical protein
MSGRWWRRVWSVTGLVVGIVEASVVAAGPAGAAPPPFGLARWGATVPGGNATVSVTVSCGFSAHRVYGTGFEINGGNGQVHLVSLLPNAALTSVTAIAAPRVVPVAPWSLTVYAICGRPTMNQHLEVASTASWLDTEVCNGGTRLYGVGARQGGSPAWTLRENIPIAPFAPPNMSQASVNPPGGMPGVASAGVCADPVPTLHSILGAFAVGSTVMCPAGELVTGPGGQVFGGNPGIVMEGIVPNAALTQVRVTARDAGGVAQPTRAFAVCA